MKLRMLLCCSAWVLALSAQGGMIYSPVNPINASIPDGSPVGWAGTATLTDYLPSITTVTVNLNLSGGYNGDLYAYLSYGGVLVPLLNRVGVQTGDAFGYATGGMNVTLADGFSDIHWILSPSSGGTYAPDGRQINPQSAPPAFDADGTIGFSAYNGMNPNGAWTLFIADLSAGTQSELVGWSLDVTAVPEPVNVALGVFAGVVLLLTLARSRAVRNRIHVWRAAVIRWIDAV